MTYHASCACGAVQIEVEGEPVAQCYCHCKSCRSFTGSPISAPVLWPRANVRFVKGEDRLRRYSRSGHGESGRFTCSVCDGVVGAYLAEVGLFDVFAGLFSDFDFKPTVHLNYENAVLSVKDGLPKLKDMPADWGGSGQTLPE